MAELLSWYEFATPPARLEKLPGFGRDDDKVFTGLDDLVRDQIMSMKTTFTPGHYRRRMAGVLARRLVTRLFTAA